MEFKALSHPTLIGSFPGKDHRKAVDQVFKYCPEVPCWPQLPAYPQEGMLRQFTTGLPGFRSENLVLDSTSPEFEAEMLAFYEEYMAIQEGAQRLSESRFVIRREEAPGLYLLVEEIQKNSIKPRAVKGQITGPFTLATGIKTPDDRAVFYDLQLRDLITKLAALKGAWQAEFLAQTGVPVIVFFDEPALAGFGSSAFVGVSEEDILQVLSEVANEIRAKGALPGTHVCANTEWRLLVEAGVSVISFDAFDYLDRFLLFTADLKRFLGQGGIIAWGIVPTLKPEALEKATSSELTERLKKAVDEFSQKTDIPPEQIVSQSLVTPSCGMGTLPENLAEQALRLTREVADQLREDYL